MVRRGRPGRPMGPSFDEYPPATREELLAAAQQAGRLGRRKDPKQLRQVYDRLIERRAGRDEGGRAPSGARLSYFEDDTGLPLLTMDELLVRTSDYEGDDKSFRRIPMRELLAPFGLAATRVELLDNRVTRLRREGMPTAQLAAIGARLRDNGYQASMNYCLPLGPIVKSVAGEVGPEPATRDKPKYPGGAPTGATVAILDTGITDQPRTDGWLENIARDASGGFDDNVDRLYDIAGAPEFDLGAGHGTFVAGVVQQVDPTADIRVIKVLGADGIGGDVEVAIGILLAVRGGARILNLSLGGETDGDQPPLATLVALEMLAEMREAIGTDVVLVAAAGNNWNTRPVWPAAFSAVDTPGVRVVSVAGLTTDFEPADFSTRGFWITFSTLANGVLSTFAKGRETPEMDPAPDEWLDDDPWAVWTGTSFAAPQVAGTIAWRVQQHGGNPSEAVDWLLDQGVWVPDFGRVLEILPAG